MTGHGYNLLIEHEGESLVPYTDSEGYLTIGVGHLLDERKGGGISKHISRIILDDDIANAQLSAATKFPWYRLLDPVRQDVVTMLVFQMGLAGFCGFKRMIDAIIAENWTQAAWELSNSQWKSQVGKERHDALTNALEHGSWDKATV